MNLSVGRGGVVADAKIQDVTPLPGLTAFAAAWDNDAIVFVVSTCACCSVGENASAGRALSIPSCPTH